jgi:hypothetical protein
MISSIVCRLCSTRLSSAELAAFGGSVCESCYYSPPCLSGCGDAWPEPSPAMRSLLGTPPAGPLPRGRGATAGRAAAGPDDDDAAVLVSVDAAVAEGRHVAADLSGVARPVAGAQRVVVLAGMAQARAASAVARLVAAGVLKQVPARATSRRGVVAGLERVRPAVGQHADGAGGVAAGK